MIKLIFVNDWLRNDRNFGFLGFALWQEGKIIALGFRIYGIGLVLTVGE